MGAQQLRRVVSSRPAFLQDEPLDPKTVPDRMSGVASSPQRSALPFPEVSNEIDTVPIERRTEPVAPNLADMKAPPTMIQRNNKGRPVAIVGGHDPIANNQELIRAQEGYKAPRSTKDQLLALATGGIPGAIGYATDQNVRNRWAVGDDIASEENQIARDLGVQGKQASIAAARQRPVIAQAQVDAKNAQQDEREVNDALSQYNRLESYDPNDPSFVSLKQYFKSRGLELPKKVKGSNVIADWSNGRLTLTNKTDATSRDTTVTDAGRTPNAAGLNPNQQATVDTSTANRTSREAEGQKNREARAVNTDKILTAIAGRQDKQIAASIAALGDPQEMYGAASDLWSQAQSKEQQANSMTIATTADVETKKQLLNEAVKLREATVRIQQEARKAASAGRVRTASPSSQYAGKPWSVTKWRSAHPSATPEQESAAKAKAVAAQMKVVE